MSWKFQLSHLSLKAKLAITVLGAGSAVLGLSTYLSFKYWRQEARAVAEQQALLAALSTRASLEASFNHGNAPAAQRTLEQLLRNAAVQAARVYGPDGRVIISARPEEVGRPSGKIWIPRAHELPRSGVARTQHRDDSHSVHAFAPTGSGMQDVLEIEFSIAAVESAMSRGARLGAGLLIASLITIGLIIYALFLREVAPEIAELKRKGEDAERLAEQRGQILEERAGFAEVGELAAEMAHEFKRPLASIQSAIQLLEQEYTVDEEGQKLLAGIGGQLDRLSDTMQDVFGLAKPITVRRDDVNLRDVLDNALLQLAANRDTSALTVRRNYVDSALCVQGDARRLEAAFLNLMYNAAEAMPEGGVLTIAVEPDADTVDVTFSDTGCGIDPADVQRVMRPFYSTKKTGTGLGLPLVARIIAAHYGQLHIESEKGVGTTVRVRLPLETDSRKEEDKWQHHASLSSTMTIS